ncbi:MAG TPA: MarR family transcriptional regulator [Pseudonocardiaceae bacterium]|nr:MarR family transcriptional regulator [Pseudonocardiaceae bacterium]
MSSIGHGNARNRRRLNNLIRDSLREVSSQLSLLNHRVSSQLGIKDADYDCLDLIGRHGPLSPSALAKRAGLHPATITGILDRLERAGWVTRERDPADRRAVLVHARRDRSAEIFHLYTGMNSAMDELISGYTEGELAVLADFLQRTAAAGKTATDELAD